MNHIFRIFVVTLFVSLPAFAEGILGETADYIVDKDPKRTSGMIKKGSFNAVVSNFVQQTVSAPASYEVSLNYNLNISIVGNQQGSQKALLEEKFFTEEFLEDLRKNGTYEGPNFKAKHLGYANAKTLDGNYYPNCDRVLLYDLKQTPTAEFFSEMLATAHDLTRDQIENLQVVAHIYPGIPVLGGAKIDVSGKYSGMNVKMGADYQSK